MVYEIPGDGDCLFSSLLHQLENHLPAAPNHATKVIDLRRRVVAYIRYRLQDAVLQDEWVQQMVGSMDDDPCNRYSAVDASGNPVELDVRVRAYLNDLETGEVWGSGETLRAVAEIYNVSVNLYYEYRNVGGRPPLHIHPVGGPEAATRQIAVVFRLPPGQPQGVWNHYESFLFFRGP